MNQSRLLPCLLMLGLTACASTTTVDTRYVVADKTPPLQRILLVAHTPETEQQAEWETACAEALSGPRLEVVPSHEVMTLGYGGGDEPLLKWARQNTAGGVLLAELTQLLLSPIQVPPRDFMRPDREIDGMTDEPMTGITLGRQPAQPRLEQRLGFRLLRADGTVLWDGVTETREANDLEAIAASQCEGLKAELTRLGLIPR